LSACFPKNNRLFLLIRPLVFYKPSGGLKQCLCLEIKKGRIATEYQLGNNEYYWACEDKREIALLLRIEGEYSSGFTLNIAGQR